MLASYVGQSEVPASTIPFFLYVCREECIHLANFLSDLLSLEDPAVIVVYNK